MYSFFNSQVKQRAILCVLGESYETLKYALTTCIIKYFRILNISLFITYINKNNLIDSSRSLYERTKLIIQKTVPFY